MTSTWDLMTWACDRPHTHSHYTELRDTGHATHTGTTHSFSGTKSFFFQTFRGILFVFMWTKTSQYWLLNAEISCNVFFYSKCRMGLKFLNSELQMLCKKINKCIGNQQCNRHRHFPGQHYSFKNYIPGLSILFQDLYEPCYDLCRSRQHTDRDVQLLTGK